MKFRTAYDINQATPSPSGSRYLSKYIRKEGSSDIILSGTEDVYDSIQKSSLGITVESLIRRAQAGDSSAIGNPEELSYLDISSAPKDLLEAHTMLCAAKMKYDSLPSELKSKFDNDFGKFLNAAGNGQAFEEFYKLNNTEPNKEEILENA